MGDPERANHDDQFEIPPLGGARFFLILATIIAFFVAVAVYNLIHSAGLSTFESCGSIVWLIIVSLWIVVAYFEAGGLRQMTVNLLGMFAHHGFVQVERDQDGSELICYGYEMFERRHFYFKVPVGLIARVHWSAGQASDVSGRDVDDWTVGIWFHPDGGPFTWTPDDWRTKTLHIVGPHLPRRDATALGNALVKYLRDRGVRLDPTEKDCEFNVAYEVSGTQSQGT